jgi:hypothetical protein
VDDSDRRTSAVARFGVSVFIRVHLWFSDFKSFVRYNAFASQVDRRHRRYGGKSLDMAVADLIDLAEAKGLDREILLAQSREVLKLPKPEQPATGARRPSAQGTFNRPPLLDHSTTWPLLFRP